MVNWGLDKEIERGVRGECGDADNCDVYQKDCNFYLQLSTPGDRIMEK